MPAKGTTYISGKRNVIIDKEFCDNLRKETNLDIDDKTIRNIILESNQEISDIIVNDEQGFKLPEGLGYIVITKYKSNKKAVDWINSIKLSKKVLLTNLHSFGYVYHIKWYKKNAANFAFKDAYRLEPVRVFKRNVAKSIKSGKIYHQWSNGDFLNSNKIIKKLHKK